MQTVRRVHRHIRTRSPTSSERRCAPANPVNRHNIWFWLKFREDGGWLIVWRIDVRFVR